MKHKLSISLSQDTMLRIFDVLRTRQFKSKSHFVETAINSFVYMKNK
jgi:metal-responsive CopG/Arc/MetJ family transcriptional regulator